MKYWRFWRIDWQPLWPFFSLLAALATLALGLTNLVRELEPWLLLSMAIFGLWVGWSLARSRLSGWVSGILGLFLGGMVVFIRVGRLGGLLLALIRALLHLGWSTLRWPQVGPPDLSPLLTVALTLRQDLDTLLTRLSTWIVGLLTNNPAFDPAAIALVWGLTIWSVSLWAGWLVRRHNQPLPALMPAGALLAVSLFAITAKPWPLLAFLGATLMLLATNSTLVRERYRQTRGLKAAADIAGERLLTAAVLSLTLVAMAGLVPSISVETIVELVARLTDKPASESRSVASSLGLKRNSGAQTAIDRARVPGLPQQQLLGSGPELVDRVVMIIQVEQTVQQKGEPEPADQAELRERVRPAREPLPAPRFYWRSLSYERYTGRGWWTGTPKRVDYKAGQSIPVPFGFNQVRQRRLVQRIQVVTNTDHLVYSAGTLTRVDKDYTAAWRSRSDLSGLNNADTINELFGAIFAPTGEATSNTTYQVESWLPVVSETQLRAAGADYPAWIRQRYLALPEEVPARVLGLGRDLTATQPTPYDRARALETFLRTFPYQLDLPPPPAERDVVDYFLFDLKQGYCDYYASAMVVLARAAGIPARLVVGFLSGTYDTLAQHYVVTAADAHSWVEVYFPAYGWVEFDPTARLPPIERATEREATAVLTEAEPLLATHPPERAPLSGPKWLGLLARLGLLSLAGGLGLVVWGVIDDWRLHRLPLPATMTVIYQRLLRYGNRLAVPMQSGDTPYQFLQAFGQRLTDLALNKGHQTTLVALQTDLMWLIDFFVQVYYSPHVSGDTDRTQVLKRWRRLRRRLWFVRLLNWRKNRNKIVKKRISNVIFKKYWPMTIKNRGDKNNA